MYLCGPGKHSCQPFCGPEGRFYCSDSVCSLWPAPFSYLCVSVMILCVCWKLSAAEQVKTDCCHTPAVVSTLLTPLPVSCPLTTPHHYNFGAASRISGAATRDLSSQRQQQRPILTMNAADNPGQPPAPPTLHSLRPHKLRRFSGDEGDVAEDFVREAKLFLELGPMADPAAAAWLLGALEGRAKQEMLSMGADEVNTPGKIFAILEQHWGEHRDSSTLLGRSSGASRGSQSRWGSTPPTFVSSGRKPMLSRRAPSPLSCCGTPLRVGFIPCLWRET